MIWTIVLWMAMQGQAHESPATVHCTQQTMAGVTWNICQDNCNNANLPECRQQTPAPAEHVFEIRAVQERHVPCFNYSRSLWMDGKRLGIIKGLD